ncbi:hypothetical protein [Planktothricoides raciborskii]|uniref:hypothetical protein n=1 Tax=Planktothricoides raciborskii TaxID=132608 RepID=UPI0012E2121C|nr:hypothetical protein [Planktothricoides raciborskii]
MAIRPYDFSLLTFHLYGRMRSSPLRLSPFPDNFSPFPNQQPKNPYPTSNK